MQLKLTTALGFLVTVAAAWKCTEGTAWTPDEYEEYLSIDDTTGWAPMSKIPHCTIEESDLQAANDTTLEARGGGNKFVAYANYGCSSNALFSVQNFGCGGCYSVGALIYSGYLWRQTTGNPYPTVDFYPGPECQGSRIHHQGILSGKYESCDSINGALSAVVYQGC